jgi:hypothetical protein
MRLIVTRSARPIVSGLIVGCAGCMMVPCRELVDVRHG